MRPIWTGALSFGLVNIPVRLYSATAGTTLNLDMLHKKDLQPIRYARVCRSDGKEVPYADIVKGYEYRDGDYVVLTEEDIKKAYARRTKMIEIIDFTKENQIDPIYYEKPYYLEPEKGAEKAYGLLYEALKRSKKVGVAKFVLRNKEHLAVIRPFGKAVVVEQLRFDEELRKPDELNLPKTTAVKGREIQMALALIEQLTAPFKPKDYKDTYQHELKKVIAAKAKGKPIKKHEKEPEVTEVADIMKLLKESLEKEHVRAKA